jgi:nicotinate-nucleotide--dimethylbenzimidazole phosphoribosyltransferase
VTEKELMCLKVDGPDMEIERKIKEIWDGIAKPLDGLGQFETMIARIGAIAGGTRIDISSKAVIVLCADNGIVEEGISQTGQEVTVRVAESMGRGESSVCRMAKAAGADVIAVDIGINSKIGEAGIIDRKISCGTKNFLKEPAMTKKETLRAVAVGMELVKDCKRKGYALLATGEMGIGNTTTSAAVTAALLGCRAEDIAGRGAGLSNEGLNRKYEVINSALEKYRFQMTDVLGILAAVGGLDIAGLTGIFIGGGLYRVPIVMDGSISAAAALAAQRLVPGVKEFIIPSHVSREPAAGRIMEELGLHPVIDGKMALGEGTGAVMMFSLLDIALSVYANRTGFQDISVQQYVRFD